MAFTAAWPQSKSFTMRCQLPCLFVYLWCACNCAHAVSVRICILFMQEIVCALLLHVGIYMEAFNVCCRVRSGSKYLPFNRDFNVCENEQEWSERGREREQTLCDDVIVPVE